MVKPIQSKKRAVVLNGNTRILRSEVLDLCEMIYDMGSLPGVRGPGAGSVPARAPDPDLPEAQPALGTACRGLRLTHDA